MKTLIPMRLLRVPDPFDHDEFVFEPKFDGFRAIARVEGRRCTLLSRNGNVFKSWPQLAEEIAHSVQCRSAVLDGEIVCLDRDGRSNFRNLLFRREWPHFMAFDVLELDGEDVRALPLATRKRRLDAVLPRTDGRVRPVDYIERNGVGLFRAACGLDLEGIVAKYVRGQYCSDGRTTSWLKIKNPDYSQMVDRHELFERPARRTGQRALSLVLR